MAWMYHLDTNNDFFLTFLESYWICVATKDGCGKITPNYIMRNGGRKIYFLRVKIYILEKKFNN